MPSQVAVTAYLSFDIYSSSPSPDAIGRAVQEIVRAYAITGRWILRHLLEIQLEDSATFDDLGKALHDLHAKPTVGPHFDFVAVGWSNDAGEVWVAAQPRPAAAAKGLAPPLKSLVSTRDPRASEMLFSMEVTRGFRDLAEAAKVPTPRVLPLDTASADRRPSAPKRRSSRKPRRRTQ